jgi:hypothetical protein
MSLLRYAAIAALPPDQGWAALLEHFTEEERGLLAASADQINALPPDRRLALAKAIAQFARNRVSS